MKVFGSYWVRRAQLALIGMALWFVVTCGGCAGSVFDGTAPVVPNPETTPLAVVEAARGVLSLFAGDSRCSATVLTPERALSDRHCYDAPTETVFGFVTEPRGMYIWVSAAGQPKLDEDVVTLTLSDDPGVPDAVIGAEPPAKDEPVWMAGHGCEAARAAKAPLLHVGVVDSTLGNQVAIRNLEPATCGGDSGGGVFNARGELVALMRAYDVDSDGHYVHATQVTEKRE